MFTGSPLPSLVVHTGKELHSWTQKVAITTKFITSIEDKGALRTLLGSLIFVFSRATVTVHIIWSQVDQITARLFLVHFMVEERPFQSCDTTQGKKHQKIHFKN